MDNQLQAILFDLDGTLWDACETMVGSWNQTLAKFRHPAISKTLTLQDMQGIMGLEVVPIARKLFPDAPEELAIKAVQQCCEEECAVLRQQGGRLYPGLVETLQELQKQYPLMIVSNCQQGYIEAFLDAHKLGWLFADFLCAGDTGQGKGHNIRTILARNGLEAGVYVGDTEGDRLAAEQAGLPFIWAAYGFGRASRWDAKIQRLADLPGVLSTLGYPLK